jgi:hypothetical protein
MAEILLRQHAQRALRHLVLGIRELSVYGKVILGRHQRYNLGAQVQRVAGRIREPYCDLIDRCFGLRMPERGVLKSIMAPISTFKNNSLIPQNWQ